MDVPSVWDIALGGVLAFVLVLNAVGGTFGAAFRRILGRPTPVQQLAARLQQLRYQDRGAPHAPVHAEGAAATSSGAITMPAAGGSWGDATTAGSTSTAAAGDSPAQGTPPAEAADRARAAEEERQRVEAAAQAERERLAAEEEARRAAEEAARKAAEERQRQIRAATPQVHMTPGGSHRETVKINLRIEGGEPIETQLAVLSKPWAYAPTKAKLEQRRADGWYEELWYKTRSGSAMRPAWGTFTDAAGRTFRAPAEAPTDEEVWVVLSFNRTVGGPASVWQRFRAAGGGPLWELLGATGEPVLIESRPETTSPASNADKSQAA